MVASDDNSDHWDPMSEHPTDDVTLLPPLCAPIADTTEITITNKQIMAIVLSRSSKTTINT